MPGQRVRIHYRIRTASGPWLEDTRRSKSNLPVVLIPESLISGVREAIERMPPGAKWLLHIPPALGWEDRGIPPDIPPGSPVFYEIEVLDFF
jgi:FKBP-type peptidyl-prolyl cis-trans isomerase